MAEMSAESRPRVDSLVESTEVSLSNPSPVPSLALAGLGKLAESVAEQEFSFPQTFATATAADNECPPQKDGSVCITAPAQGKTFDMLYSAKAKGAQTLQVIGDYIAPAASRAASIYDASKVRVVQPFTPYYAKVHNGVAYIVATVGETVVVIKAKVFEVRTDIQVKIVESIAVGRSGIDHLASPWVSRAVSIRSGFAGRTEHFKVSINHGFVQITSSIRGRTRPMELRLSQVFDSIYVSTSGVLCDSRKALSDLAAKLATMVTSAYGQACNNARLLGINVKDGFFDIACQVNDRTIVFRIKGCEFVAYLQSLPMQLYSTSRTAISTSCSSARVRVLQVTEFTKAKSYQVSTSVRSVATNQQARVTAVSAAGGALALGASGGAAGLLAGGGVGVGCGVVLAPFTFGLSIPVATTLGAGAGLFLGTAAGGTAGLVTGGAAGYGAHKHKDEIGQGVNGAFSKVKTYKALAAASTKKLRAQVMGGTGGTASD